MHIVRNDAAAAATQAGGLNSVEEILADLAAGKMVVIMDDEQRENEGDLLMAASLVRPEDINFMARYGRGLICLTLTRERCQQLRLQLMVSDTDLEQRTNFTLSIEAAEGVTTGISAFDRAHTVRTAVALAAKPTDLRQPGHIFPIMAQPGGVLTRAGHTEAGCDFARLAGLEPAAVIVEIMNDDGTMARRPDLEKFAREHGLKIGTIADLIRYRLRNERSVERIDERCVSTEFGEFTLLAYQDHVHRDVHLALVRGTIAPDDRPPPLVRVHLTDTLRDVLGIGGGEGRHWTLRAAMARVAREGHGVIVILREAETPRQLADTVRALSSVDEQAPKPGEGSPVLRTYGIGAQILKDIGVRRMRVLSAPKQLHGLAAFDLEVESYVDND
ncbi:MAG: bifunctional 3,4-dihydroxy-2-butanone-4-phosphate synthase/GTP cyclohydrolase II [Steroidobacteraceae bacterium]|nr:3,4-dihydroxy-2-butanone-4-phosphate synthase [Nevskiaceae bacterium]MCP5339538.1 3,4-dihydroxy-2-butanone-4-phosphate synthase [Nevskiaceae bacterium]MCP5359170.1 3,4-dihydroxy-2-butanone-4-phosphate synthase [Nevskiaceae bacterium]MCP5466404.1 3,4-dihydroxy-2-butanone-4-phosphate synthase [Nevskiaceae bacterium]MCP5471895.1 3,4-dihydroxy-2-butanone-4-phosphate synthase [Nevskiaceae bacterium]